LFCSENTDLMRVLKVFVFTIFIGISSLFATTDSLICDWNNIPNRQWVGDDFWANRLQTWGIKDHKLYCFRPGINSTLHLLSTEIKGDEAFSGTITLGRNALSMEDSVGKSGLILGLSDTALNYLARSTMQHFFLNENGVWLGINEKKQLFIEELASKRSVVSKTLTIELLSQMQKNGVALRFSCERKNDSMEVSLFLNVDVLQFKVPLGIINGNITFVSNSSLYLSEYFFDDFSISGEGILVKKERKFGPISTCLYSFNQNILNFSAQLMPLGLCKTDSVKIDLFLNNLWSDFMILPVDSFLGQARLREFEWPYKGKIPYRVQLIRDSVPEGNFYEGVIAAPDAAGDQLKIGMLSCNGIPFIERTGMDYWQIWKPYELLAKKYKKENPELVVFLGDQMYEARPVPMEWDKTIYPLDYQYRWLLWCLQFNNITNRLPSLIIMDDHDYFQGNLWGEKGDTISKTSVPKITSGFVGDETDWLTENGGFIQTPEFLKYAVTLQTGHLPATSGTENKAVPDYYTTLKFKGIGIALLEDRKYKSAPMNALQGVPSYNGFPFSDSVAVDSLNNEYANLLGYAQESMLDNWSEEWSEEKIKIVFTQSVYSCLNSVYKGYNPVSGKNITINDTGKIATHLSKDMDSNGWPKSSRDEALKIIRKSGALLVGGDQHFPSVVQQGVDTWGDGPFSFTVPAVSNTYPRFWLPDSADHFQGNHYTDGFGNKISMITYSNPAKNNALPLWMNYAPGFAFVTCDKIKQSYKMDCWGFSDTLKQYPGWPVITKPSDNIYSSSPYSTVKIKVKGVKLPLVSVIDFESGKILYSLRCNNQRLKVPYPGTFKVRVQFNDSISRELTVSTGKGKVLVKAK
jgi:alkaline phosphatase D